MQGSLDNPPIVIANSRWKIALWFIAATVFIGLGFWGVWRNSGDPFMYLCIVGGCFLGLASVWYLFSPPRLEISSSGVLWFTGHRTKVYAWDDFVGFRAYWPGGKWHFKYNEYVGFNYTPHNPKRGKLAAMKRWWYGVDGSFGPMWEISADKIVGLLRKAKAKWGS